MNKINIRLPETELITAADFDPASYVLSERLAAAVEVALALQQPLLLTGEPGTGKTRLADRIAHDLHAADPSFSATPKVFHTKTTSTAQDLFYQYDALRHFHDANVAKAAGKAAPQVGDYIQLEALGDAIALTQADIPQSSVVLIDEIDKAPRDFPNDLLSEIETFSFRIQEDGNREIRKAKDKRIVMLLTSNSEKNLPEAFLRRCVFFHIPFPSAEKLIEIVRSQMGEQTAYADAQLIAHFQELRTVVRKKAPATAELISWLRILELHDFLGGGVNLDNLSDAQRKTLRLSYAVLAKDREDLESIEQRFL